MCNLKFCLVMANADGLWVNRGSQHRQKWKETGKQRKDRHERGRRNRCQDQLSSSLACGALFTHHHAPGCSQQACFYCCTFEWVWGFAPYETCDWGGTGRRTAWTLLHFSPDYKAGARKGWYMEVCQCSVGCVCLYVQVSAHRCPCTCRGRRTTLDASPLDRSTCLELPKHARLALASHLLAPFTLSS